MKAHFRAHFSTLLQLCRFSCFAFSLAACTPGFLPHQNKLTLSSLQTVPVDDDDYGNDSNSSGNNPQPSPNPSGQNKSEIDPSRGSGGTMTLGTSTETSSGARIYLPSRYRSDRASSVIILFNMSISQWKAIAEEDNVILVDTQSYNDVDLIFQRMDASLKTLESQYNVDRARYYFAGWSAGGNITLIYGTVPEYANSVAGIMVFPGSGGFYARDNLNSASQQRKRAVPIYYAVGDKDTSTGYYPAILNEANILASISGYQDRIKTKVWAGASHSLGSQALSEGWQWIKNFHSRL